MSFPRVHIEAPGFLSECWSVASLLQNSTRGKRTHESFLRIGRHWYASLWFHLQSHPCSLVCMLLLRIIWIFSNLSILSYLSLASLVGTHASCLWLFVKHVPDINYGLLIGWKLYRWWLGRGSPLSDCCVSEIS